MVSNNHAWQKIFDDLKIDKHDFNRSAFLIYAQDIKKCCQSFTKTTEKEPHILCKQNTRESQPQLFKDLGLFVVRIKNGQYAIIKGEGYVDIPTINQEIEVYQSKLDFHLDTAQAGDSEMQHLDFAYATSLIRTFCEDPSLVLTVRGRKYTPEFSFRVGQNAINVSSVQTEVDAGYEGKNQMVLIEAKNSNTSNVIIRQLFYPFRQWKTITQKKITTLFFEKQKNDNSYSIWQFAFSDENDYNSIQLKKSAKYHIQEQASPI